MYKIQIRWFTRKASGLMTFFSERVALQEIASFRPDVTWIVLDEGPTYRPSPARIARVRASLLGYAGA